MNWLEEKWLEYWQDKSNEFNSEWHMIRCVRCEIRFGEHWQENCNEGVPIANGCKEFDDDVFGNDIVKMRVKK